ncbi:MAG: PQQ-like beta-propeller repeat protein [Acidobacteria bacterium]|nr:PQQ-like beta-propeller repeat protein [Acidobacteriota bacterium]
MTIDLMRAPDPTPSFLRAGSAALVLVLAALTPAAGAEGIAKWPWWRGPLGNGTSPDGDPPVHWSEQENVRFKVPIDGDGLSTPIVWGDRIYILSALSLDGADEGVSPVPESSETPLPKQRFLVTAYDRHDGSVAWQRVATERVPHEGHHQESAWANASPVTDGERLYAHFGSAGTYAYTLEGELIWKVDLGDMTTRLGYGEGSSPALWGDTLVINWDHEGDSFVVALDKRTGDELWRKDRPGELTSWSTPLIREHEGRVQVIVAAAGRTRSYDLRNGEVLWSVSGLGMNVIPTPIYDEGILYLASGKRDSPRMVVVDLHGARGNLDGTDAVLWTRDRDTPYVSTPLLYRGQLYFFKHVSSFFTSVDAATGQTLFTERVGLGRVFASPVAAAGRIYLLGREGKALVLEPGPTLKVLAENQLDDGFDASPVIVGGDLYLRGRRFLYAVARPSDE